VSTADLDEAEAAAELAALLKKSGISRPFLVASERGQRLLRGVPLAGTAGRRGGVSQASAGAFARAARRAGADAVVGAGGGRCLDVAKLAAAGAEAVAPRLAFFSRPTLLGSPLGATRAGIGDLISNPLALLDWELASEAGLEQVEPRAHQLSTDAYGLVEPLLDRPFGQDEVTPRLIGLLARALAKSGLAMTATGTSRPASGAEHKISHAIDELYGGRAHHGEQVAFASLLSATLHGLEIDVLRGQLVNLGIASHPCELGLSLADMVRVLLQAPATRPGRFTILEMAALDEKGAAALLRWVWPDL
jgi:glycerol-1-phosphate dehydrogenase [NAD(P)+]